MRQLPGPVFYNGWFYANHLLFCRDYTRNIIDRLRIFVIERNTITF